jgi:hypothetical protein
MRIIISTRNKKQETRDKRQDIRYKRQEDTGEGTHGSTLERHEGGDGKKTPKKYRYRGENHPHVPTDVPVHTGHENPFRPPHPTPRTSTTVPVENPCTKEGRHKEETDSQPTKKAVGT